MTFVLWTNTLSYAKGPVSQMGDFQATNVSRFHVERLWGEMETKFIGDDCYRRAHIWAFDMHNRHRIKSKKIFLHYTNKWNRELDNMGGELAGGRFNLKSKAKRKRWKADGISKSLRNFVRKRKTWDYHVASMIVVEGRDVVMDRYLRLPYDLMPGNFYESEFFNQTARPAAPEEWIEALTASGEMLWKARKAKLIEERNKIFKKVDRAEKFIARYLDARSKEGIKRLQQGRKQRQKYRQELAGFQRTWKFLEMDQDMIDIKCQKIDSIATLDKNHENAWCFWSEAPMYYYNEIDLRNLAYGKTRYSSQYGGPAPLDIHTETNYRNGRNYVQRYFNMEEVKHAERRRR